MICSDDIAISTHQRLDFTEGKRATHVIHASLKLNVKKELTQRQLDRSGASLEQEARMAGAAILRALYGEIHERLTNIDKYLNSFHGHTAPQQLESVGKSVQDFLQKLNRLQFDDTQTQMPLWDLPSDEGPVGGAGEEGGEVSPEVS